MRQVTPYRHVETVHGLATGNVYYIVTEHRDTTWVKVGFSRNHPRARLAAMQTGNALRLDLYGFHVGSEAEEAELHDVFASERVSGEWFLLTDYVRRTIDFNLRNARDAYPPGATS